MRRLMVVLALFSTFAHAADKLKLDDVIARHLASIGTPEARAAAKTRLGAGKAQMQEVVRGSSSLSGTASLASDNRRIKIAMQFPGSPQYPGEQWVFDGDKTLVALTAPGARSSIGNFVFNYPELMREGLLGGSIFTSWSLLDLSGRQPRLKYDGLKKIDGRELHQVSYTPRKGGSGMEIRLFFDPETFRHVKTSYVLEQGSGMKTSTDARGNVLGADELAHADHVRYFLEENFADFQTVDGITLPTSWTIRYEIQPSSSAVLQWTVKVEQVKHNEQL